MNAAPPSRPASLRWRSVDNPSASERRRQQAGAFWQSLLVPGLGQLAAGRRTTGYAFLTVEAGLIGSLVGLRTYAGRMEDDYRAFAVQHAGVSPDHNHQYYVDIGNWLDARSYNDERLRDRSFDALYLNPGDAWRWDEGGSRARFKSMRIASDRARNRALMVVGGLVLNHLFAAIEAARGAAASPSLGMAPLPEGGATVMLTFFPQGP